MTDKIFAAGMLAGAFIIVVIWIINDIVDLL